MAERGAPRGQRQRIAGPRAVDSGRGLRIVALVDPALHAKAHQAAERAGLSVSGYLAFLIDRAEIDSSGGDLRLDNPDQQELELSA